MADKNTYSATGQVQAMADPTSLDTSIDKGGMRGIGVAVAAVAEAVLKKKAVDLAKDYYNINRQDYQFFQSTHQPAIASTANEANSSLNPKYAYDKLASTLAGVAKINKVDKQWYEARRRIPKYNIGQQRRLDYDMGVARKHAVTAGWNAGIRYELAWTDDHNNRAFNRKVTVSEIGINVGAIVGRGLASSVSALSSSYDTMGDTIASIGNGYAAYAGYNDARKQVKTLMDPKRSNSNG